MTVEVDVKAPLAEDAYRRLKQRILNNELPPGFQAMEQELAAELGMSRTPLREALVRLSEDGLLELLPRRGMRVLPVSPDDMREIYELLGCLEAAAVERLASQRLPADAPVLRELGEAIDEMDRTLAADDLDGWAAADERFHAALLDGCGNRRLARMAYTVWDQSHRARMVTLRLRPRPERSNADHRAVLEAIRAHDAETARELHRRHRMTGMTTLLTILETYRLNRL